MPLTSGYYFLIFFLYFRSIRTFKLNSKSFIYFETDNSCTTYFGQGDIHCKYQHLSLQKHVIKNYCIRGSKFSMHPLCIVVKPRDGASIKTEILSCGGCYLYSPSLSHILQFELKIDNVLAVTQTSSYSPLCVVIFISLVY